MTHPTDEELDALVVWLEELPCCHDGPHETSARCKSCEKTVADAITTLRTQLAEVKTEKEKLGRELNLARYGQPDFSWQVHKEALSEANARADRAEQRVATLEAALAEIKQTLDAPDDWHPVYAVKALKQSNDRAEAALTAQPSPDVAALVEALEWYISEDETNEGDEPMPDHGNRSWNEINSYWIEGKRKAEAALALVKGGGE